MRAVSADRDSDFSELMTSSLATRAGGNAHSLDSIPDDSGFADPDARALREQIAHLQQELVARDEQVREAEVKAEALASLKSQLTDVQLKLETERNRNKTNDSESESKQVSPKSQIVCEGTG